MISTEEKIAMLRGQTLESGPVVPVFSCLTLNKEGHTSLCLPAGISGCGHDDFLPSAFEGMAESRLKSIKLVYWKNSKTLADAGSTGLPSSLAYLLLHFFSKKVNSTTQIFQSGISSSFPTP